MVFRMV